MKADASSTGSLFTDVGWISGNRALVSTAVVSSVTLSTHGIIKTA